MQALILSLALGLPPQAPPLNDYTACRAAVVAGKSVTLAVGVTVTADYHTATLEGFQPGVYQCYPESGRPVMRIVSAIKSAPIVQFLNGNCPSGQCPNIRR